MAGEETLLDVLRARAEERSGRGHRFFNPRRDDFVPISHADLVGMAFTFAHSLAEHGVRERDYCLVCCRSLSAALTAFYGAISLGAIPLLLATPRAMQGNRALSERIAGLRADLGERTALLVQAELASEEDFGVGGPGFTVVVPDDPLSTLPPLPAPPRWRKVAPDNVAYLQGTSASTGKGKLVAITHFNVNAGIHGILTACHAMPDETVVSWLPLYHDMGLVGCELFSLWSDYDLFLLSPFDFLKRPVRWLRTISRHGGTLSPAPDFGYSYCVRLVREEDAAELDLSSWRVACTAAEPIRLATVEQFCSRFRGSGFRPETFLPCYGLAEATLGVTFTVPAALPKYARIRRIPAGPGAEVEVRGTAVVGDGEDGRALESDVIAFSVGRPLPSLKIWLIDEQGRKIDGEARAGEVVVSGAAVAAGYVNDGGESLTRFTDGVATGDLGFLFEGDLYILERLNNVIIRNGENHLASALEEQIADRLGIPFDSVAVFEASILGADNEVVAVVEVPARTDLSGLLADSSSLPVLTESVAVGRLLLTPARTIPRTTSGKKRHFLCRSLLA